MRSLLPLAIVLALAFPASAEECVPSTTPARVCPVGTAPGMPCVPSEAAGRYFSEDGCTLVHTPGYDCHYTFWVYEESNGLAGLQRADEVVDDTCGGRIPGDTIVL